MKRRSIAKELAAIFIGLMIVVLASNLLINNFFMERYYVVRLQDTLTDAYRMMDEHIPGGEIDTGYFVTEFRELCSSNNIDMVVVDENYNIMIRTAGEDSGAGSGFYNNSILMQTRLFGYTTGIDQDDAKILIQKENYTIQQKSDNEIDMDYLEIWGQLTCGYYFMMRIPQAAIRLNAEISNRFYLYISIIVLVVSLLMIAWVSRAVARPIRELTDISGRMAHLDFDAKYTSGGKNEIGELGENFNVMSEKLQETISQLKTANNELMKDIEKKSQIDEMRKEFLSNVSHELKTPLALIQGYAEGLKECVNDDAESRDYYCDVITDEAAKMNQLVQKLLTLNQLESGNDQVQMERFDLVQLIRGKIQSSGILAQQKNAGLIYIGPDRLHVWGDEFKTEEVLTNYLSNALNHVEGERRIEVRAALTGDGKRVRTVVFNTGQPIPENDIDQIWDKFYKVDKARTREYGGSGVGLSIVRAIMDSFHQECGVQNVEDGVEFWFELENADAEE